MTDSLAEPLVLHVVSFLPPFDAANLESAGGYWGRICLANAEVVWRHRLEPHRWLVPVLPRGEPLKPFVLKLHAKSLPGTLRAAGHVCLIGGNFSREHFAEEPVTDVTCIRDAPPLHGLNERQLREREAALPALRGRPMYRSLPAELLEARSTCAAVRRPTDGALATLCGWNGAEALASCEVLRCGGTRGGGGGGGGGGAGVCVGGGGGAEAKEDAQAAMQTGDGSVLSSVSSSSSSSSSMVDSWRWRSLPDTALRRCYLAGVADQAGTLWAIGGGSTLWQHVSQEVA